MKSQFGVEFKACLVAYHITEDFLRSLILELPQFVEIILIHPDCFYFTLADRPCVWICSLTIVSFIESNDVPRSKFVEWNRHSYTCYVLLRLNHSIENYANLLIRKNNWSHFMLLYYHLCQNHLELLWQKSFEEASRDKFFRCIFWKEPRLSLLVKESAIEWTSDGFEVIFVGLKRISQRFKFIQNHSPILQHRKQDHSKQTFDQRLSFTVPDKTDCLNIKLTSFFIFA